MLKLSDSGNFTKKIDAFLHCINTCKLQSNIMNALIQILIELFTFPKNNWYLQHPLLCQKSTIIRTCNEKKTENFHLLCQRSLFDIHHLKKDNFYYALF